MAEQDQDDTDALDGDHDGSFGEDGVRRPMNAFFIFCKRHRDVVREKYPHLENRSITKILGEWWANLDASEKSSYTALAKQYKEAFMKAHPDFKWYKLPTPPTRTLITRPSNNRLQSKKEKILPKLPSCGITLGKLADEEHLGGLSSLISPSTSDSSTTSEVSLSASTPLPTPPANNMLKPPKKRYLVNGEFMCNSTPLTYDNRDDQTQNACSALLELAEICTSGVQHPTLTHKTSDTPSYTSLFDNLSNTTPTNSLLCKSSITLKNLANTSALSSHEQSLQASKLHSHSEHLDKHTPPLSSPPVFSISDDYGQQLQDQPLNLCKTKSKTFTARNQQLIDHFVDKFLCDTPSCHSSPTKSMLLDPPISEFASSKLPNLTKNSSTHHGFTLSAAIESAIDQAYSKDPPVSPKLNKVAENKVEPPPLEKVEEEPTEVVFIDKIKKACLASSRKLSEKPATNQYIPSTKDDKQKTESSDIKVECKSQPVVELATSVSSQNCTYVEATKPGLSSTNLKRDIKFSSSSKYYSKFVSPPKKSRIWCNLFMKEQLKEEEDDATDSNTDSKKSMVDDLNSPVRRNSQRTCKGRRYQALITEGLLQSTKERKAASAAKKPSPPTERVKTRQQTNSVESPPAKSKKKRRDISEKSRTTQKEEDSSSEQEKNIFDLNEKIASLPKCSIEMLNKKKKVGQDGTSNVKSASASSSKKAAKAASAADSKFDETSPQSPQNDSSSSSGRYKSGSFDLEQHIASLPKCDIEVLNKRRSKKE